MQPGHVHSDSGTMSGNLHSPWILECSRLVRAILPRHPAHLCHHGSSALPLAMASGTSSSASGGISPPPLAISGYISKGFKCLLRFCLTAALRQIFREYVLDDSPNQVQNP